MITGQMLIIIVLSVINLILYFRIKALSDLEKELDKPWDEEKYKELLEEYKKYEERKSQKEKTD